MAVNKPSRRVSEFHGILLVDKPAGITSHDVVDRIRRIFATRRVGHTGTLDPQATGLLVLLLGEATKISEFLIGHDKSYEGSIRFGVVSDTYDAEGKIVPGPGGPIPTDLDALQEAISELTGEIDQTPPVFSAKKVAGKKLYEYARQGMEVPEIKARRISVTDFEILTLENGEGEFGVDCSSGTYVRSLVHDLGQKLGCGAILTELNRTDVGPFHLEDAWLLENLEKLGTKAKLREALIPIRTALHSQMPTLFLAPGAEQWLRNGQAISHNMVHSEDDQRPSRGTRVLLSRLNGEAVAIARVDPAPASPPPKAMGAGGSPWYQPLKQFEIATPSPEDDEDDELPVADEAPEAEAADDQP